MRRDSGHRWSVLIFAATFFVAISKVTAADLDELQQQFLSGNYSACITSLQKEIADGAGGEDRHLLLSKALLTVGRYHEAYKAITNALEQHSSTPLNWQPRKLFLVNGQTDAATQIVDDILKRMLHDSCSNALVIALYA